MREARNVDTVDGVQECVGTTILSAFASVASGATTATLSALVPPFLDFKAEPEDIRLENWLRNRFRCHKLRYWPFQSPRPLTIISEGLVCTATTLLPDQ